MVELKASTKAGQRVIAMGNNCTGRNLYDLYKNPSDRKVKEYNILYREFLDDSNATCFGVGNANCFSFTCSWLLIKDGHNYMRVSTKDSDYLVDLDN